MRNKAIAAAFILWSAANYLAYYSGFLSSGNLAKALHKLAVLLK